MRLSARLKKYYRHLDKYVLDLALPGYMDSEDDARDVAELDAMWDKLEPGDRSRSDYSMYCAEYANPVELDICKDVE